MEEDAGIAKLTAQNIRLKLEKENALLRSEIAALATPWWRKASSVTVLTTIVAAVIPITTAVQGCVQKSKEIAMEQERQSEQIRTAYLDRIKDSGVMVRMLRFVEATAKDPDLRNWAKQEKNEIAKEIGERYNVIKDLEDKVQRAEREYSDAIGQPDPQRSSAQAIDALRSKLDLAREELAEKKRSLAPLAEQCTSTDGKPACNCITGDPLCSCL